MIIQTRISKLTAFDGNSVKLCSNKIAGVSGDARRALELCRHAAVVAEREFNSKVRELQALKDEETEKMDQLEADLKTMVVKMAHVDKALEEVLFDGVNNFVDVHFNSNKSYSIQFSS